MSQAQFIEGITWIDRTRGCPLPLDSRRKPLKPIRWPRATPRHPRAPQVFWTCTGLHYRSPKWIEKNELLASNEAARLGFRCVVIRQGNHGTIRERDPATHRPTGHQVHADAHLTLYLGDSITHLLLQGHLYCQESNGQPRKRLPVAKMKEGDRKIIQNHEALQGITQSTAPVVEYWGMNGSCGYKGENRVERIIIKKPMAVPAVPSWW